MKTLEPQVIDKILKIIYDHTSRKRSLTGLFPGLGEYYKKIVADKKFSTFPESQLQLKQIIDYILHLENLYHYNNKASEDYFRIFFSTSYEELPEKIRIWLDELDIIKLKQSYWRFLIPGNDHHRGPYALEASKIGQLRALRNGFFYTLLFIEYPLSFDLLERMDQRFNERVFLISEKEKSLTGKYSTPINWPTSFELKDGNYDQLGLMELQRKISSRPKIFTLKQHRKRQNKIFVYLTYFDKASLQAVCTEIIDTYHQDLSIAETKTQKLSAIVTLVQGLVQLRTCSKHNLAPFIMTLLNRELIREFKTAIWLDNPEVFDGYSNAELINIVWECIRLNTLRTIDEPPEEEMLYFNDNFTPRPNTIHEHILAGDWDFVRRWLNIPESDINELDPIGKSVFFNLIMFRSFHQLGVEDLHLALAKVPELSEKDVKSCITFLKQQDEENLCVILLLAYFKHHSPKILEELTATTPPTPGPDYSDEEEDEAECNIPSNSP